MGYATADGQYHEDELSFLKQSFQDYASGSESSGPLKITVTPPQDASQIDSKPRTEVLQGEELPTPSPESAGDKPNLIQQGARWVRDNTGIGKESIVAEFIKGLQKNGQVVGKFLDGSINQDDPAFTEAVTGLVGDLGILNAPAAMFRPGTAGIFGGALGASKAGGVEIKHLNDALTKLETKDPSEVYQRTGWWKDARDGKWKFEINDSGAKVNTEVINKMDDMAGANIKAGSNLSFVKVPLDRVLEHSDLYKAYPDLKDVPVYFDKHYTNSVAAAGFSPNTGDLVMVFGPRFQAMNASEKRGVVLHETQHLVQEIENFAKGGMVNQKPANTLKGIAEQLGNEYRDLTARGYSTLSSAEKDRLANLRKFALETGREADKASLKAYNDYRKLGGEMESNNVDTRDALRSIGIDKMPHPSETEKLDPANVRSLMKLGNVKEFFDNSIPQ